MGKVKIYMPSLCKQCQKFFINEEMCLSCIWDDETLEQIGEDFYVDEDSPNA